MKSICFVAVALLLSLSSCQQRRNQGEPAMDYDTASVETVDAVDSAYSADETSYSDVNEETETASSSSEYGEYARINQECLAAKDGYFSDLNKYCNRNDESSVRAGVAAGVFTVLQPGRCSIVDRGFGKTKVSVNGEEWWVSSEFVD